VPKRAFTLSQIPPRRMKASRRRTLSRPCGRDSAGFGTRSCSMCAATSARRGWATA